MSIYDNRVFASRFIKSKWIALVLLLAAYIVCQAHTVTAQATPTPAADESLVSQKAVDVTLERIRLYFGLGQYQQVLQEVQRLEELDPGNKMGSYYEARAKAKLREAGILDEVMPTNTPVEIDVTPFPEITQGATETRETPPVAPPVGTQAPVEPGPFGTPFPDNTTAAPGFPPAPAATQDTPAEDYNPFAVGTAGTPQPPPGTPSEAAPDEATLPPPTATKVIQARETPESDISEEAYPAAPASTEEETMIFGLGLPIIAAVGGGIVVVLLIVVLIFVLKMRKPKKADNIVQQAQNKAREQMAATMPVGQGPEEAQQQQPEMPAPFQASYEEENIAPPAPDEHEQAPDIPTPSSHMAPEAPEGPPDFPTFEKEEAPAVQKPPEQQAPPSFDEEVPDLPPPHPSFEEEEEEEKAPEIPEEEPELEKKKMAKEPQEEEQELELPDIPSPTQYPPQGEDQEAVPEAPGVPDDLPSFELSEEEDKHAEAAEEEPEFPPFSVQAEAEKKEEEEPEEPPINEEDLESSDLLDLGSGAVEEMESSSPQAQKSSAEELGEGGLSIDDVLGIEPGSSEEPVSEEEPAKAEQKKSSDTGTSVDLDSFMFEGTSEDQAETMLYTPEEKSEAEEAPSEKEEIKEEGGSFDNVMFTDESGQETIGITDTGQKKEEDDEKPPMSISLDEAIGEEQEEEKPAAESDVIAPDSSETLVASPEEKYDEEKNEEEREFLEKESEAGELDEEEEGGSFRHLDVGSLNVGEGKGESFEGSEQNKESHRNKALFNTQFKKGKEAFEKENWKKAVHYLTIAAAIRSDVPELKEMLSEARAKKREMKE